MRVPLQVLALAGLVGCGADRITGPLPVVPPPPPPPVVPALLWDVTGSVWLLLDESPRPVLTGYEVRVNGHLLHSHSVAARRSQSFPLSAPLAPSSGTVVVSIRITGLDAPQADYVVLRQMTARRQSTASQVRTMLDEKEVRTVVRVGSTVNVEFEVPPD